MGERILVVDDEPRVIRLVTEVLTAVGYEVMAATSGESALRMIALEDPRLVLLDIRLQHGIDGYEVCGRIREFSDVPVIMLTAKAQERDLLRGFEVGTDDYLTKPFSAQELVARVRALLRRARSPEGVVTATFQCGEMEIDFARRGVRMRGREVSLTRTEYELLSRLAVNANRVMSHEDLLTAVWGPEYRNDVDYLRAYVRYLRRKLEPDPTHPRYIVTYPGVGYMLTCPEQEEDPAASGGA